jgi:hypothetical protein
MSSINVFGLPILQDANHTITRIDNDTYIIRPTMNTTGLTELKVTAHSLLLHNRSEWLKYLLSSIDWRSTSL